MIKNMELAQVRRGESFILDGVKFVKLDEDAHASFVLTADVFSKHIPFEHKDAERKDHDNFVGSSRSTLIFGCIRGIPISPRLLSSAPLTCFPCAVRQFTAHPAFSDGY